MRAPTRRGGRRSPAGGNRRGPRELWCGRGIMEMESPRVGAMRPPSHPTRLWPHQVGLCWPQALFSGKQCALLRGEGGSAGSAPLGPAPSRGLCPPKPRTSSRGDGQWGHRGASMVFPSASAIAVLPPGTGCLTGTTVTNPTKKKKEKKRKSVIFYPSFSSLDRPIKCQNKKQQQQRKGMRDTGQDHLTVSSAMV